MGKKENKPANFEEAKQKILEIIKEVSDKNTNTLIKSIEKVALSEQQEKSNKDNLKLPQPIIFLFIILGIILIALFLSLILPPKTIDSKNIDLRVVLTYLAFVIALASYVASVVRHILEKLPPKTKIKDRIKQKTHLFYLVSAEILLVIAGVLAIVRIFTGSCIHEISGTCINFSFDAFLITFLATILFYMAILHGRIWFIVKPWDIKDNDEK
ncbi:MAG TPA: hypothetical protein VKA38_08275 [Draconibacterium sp.]|nr:hypothetical protein [Draconibacterium sp.]